MSHDEPTTFRFRRGVLLEGLICTAFFLAMLGGFLCLPYVAGSSGHGDRNAFEFQVVVVLGSLFWTAWAVLGAYPVLSYFFGGVILRTDELPISSIWGERRIGINAVKLLSWVAPRAAVHIRAGGRRTTLILDTFNKHDRLEIIRRLQAAILPTRQEGWDRFCLKVALPLRGELESDGEPLAPLLPGLDDPHRVIITRRRYNVALLIALPLSTVMAAIGWRYWGLPQLIGLPLVVLSAWMLLFFSTPRRGMRSPSLDAVPGGRALALYLAVVLLAPVLALAVHRLGLSEAFESFVMVAIVLAPVPPLFLKMRRGELQRRQREAAAASAAIAAWDAGEHAINS